MASMTATTIETHISLAVQICIQVTLIQPVVFAARQLRGNRKVISEIMAGILLRRTAVFVVTFVGNNSNKHHPPGGLPVFTSRFALEVARSRSCACPGGCCDGFSAFGDKSLKQRNILFK